jgi:dinuclear metal center YbgI/SA1388 family protein
MSRLSEIYDYIDSFAPFSLQLEWDNSGILVNCGDCVVSKALVTLDITAEVLNEAIDGKYDLIVSHHPVIFGSLSALTEKTPAAICFKNGISVISAHTNYDLSPIGVNKVLAQKLNLHNVVSSNDSCFMIGELDKPMTSDMFSEYVGKCLSAHLRYNDCTKEIKTVAVCGGAGSDFASDAKKAGADALVTGDGKYHEFLDATDEEILLVSAGHYETEFPAVVSLCKLLEDKFKDIQFKVAEQKTPIKNI